MLTKTQKDVLAAKGAVDFLEAQAREAKSLVALVVIDTLLDTARDELQDAKLRELFRVS
ncbi:hypothetical protein SEA_BIG4_296 [Microbacterium phage Big4]|nr:hypothetical protein SEA_BIG4_296 [Microbacterium phage Big4]